MSRYQGFRFKKIRRLGALRNLRPKSRVEKGGELSVLGSPVTGFSGTTRILKMGFQLSTF